MKKRIYVSYAGLTIFFSIIVIITILILQIPTLISFLSDDTDTRLSAIISTIGNISGGIIGGLVAYIVAAYQVSKSQEQNEQANLKQSYINLSLLLNEIELNEKVFSSLGEESLNEQATFLKQNLKQDQWNKISPSFAIYLDRKNFKDICSLYSQIDYLKTNEQISQQFIVTIHTSLKELKKNINMKLNELLSKIH